MQISDKYLSPDEEICSLLKVLSVKMKQRNLESLQAKKYLSTFRHIIGV